MAQANRLKAPVTLAAVVLIATLLTAVAGYSARKRVTKGSTTSIAFTSDRADKGGILDIYRMDANGHGPSRKLTDTPGNSVMPSWSADGPAPPT